MSARHVELLELVSRRERRVRPGRKRGESAHANARMHVVLALAFAGAALWPAEAQTDTYVVDKGGAKVYERAKGSDRLKACRNTWMRASLEAGSVVLLTGDPLEYEGRQYRRVRCAPAAAGDWAKELKSREIFLRVDDVREAADALLPGTKFQLVDGKYWRLGPLPGHSSRPGTKMGVWSLYAVGRQGAQKKGGSSLLRVGDIFEWPRFCSELNVEASKETRSPGRRIWELLPPEVQRAAADAAGQTGLELEVKSKVVKALNDILRRPDFYHREYFSNLDISEEAKKLLQADRNTLSDTELHRLNRLLLEASYPDEVAMSWEGFLLATAKPYGKDRSPWFSVVNHRKELQILSDPRDEFAKEDIDKAEAKRAKLGPGNCPPGDELLDRATEQRASGQAREAMRTVAQALRKYAEWGIDTDSTTRDAISTAKVLQQECGGKGVCHAGEASLDEAENLLEQGKLGQALAAAREAVEAFEVAVAALATKAKNSIADATALQDKVGKGEVPDADKALDTAMALRDKKKYREAISSADTAAAKYGERYAQKRQEVEKLIADAVKWQNALGEHGSPTADKSLGDASGSLKDDKLAQAKEQATRSLEEYRRLGPSVSKQVMDSASKLIDGARSSGQVEDPKELLRQAQDFLADAKDSRGRGEHLDALMAANGAIRKCDEWVGGNQPGKARTTIAKAEGLQREIGGKGIDIEGDSALRDAHSRVDAKEFDPAIRAAEKAVASYSRAFVSLVEDFRTRMHISDGQVPDADTSLREAKQMVDSRKHFDEACDKASDALSTYRAWLLGVQERAKVAVAQAQGHLVNVKPGVASLAHAALTKAKGLWDKNDFVAAETEAKRVQGLLIQAVSKVIAEAKALGDELGRRKDEVEEYEKDEPGLVAKAQQGDHLVAAAQTDLETKAYAKALDGAAAAKALYQYVKERMTPPIPPEELRRILLCHHWPEQEEGVRLWAHAKAMLEQAPAKLSSLSPGLKRWALARELAERYGNGGLPETSIADSEMRLVAEPPKTDLLALCETWKRQAEAPELAFDLDYIQTLGARIGSETRGWRGEVIERLVASQDDLRQRTAAAAAALAKGIVGRGSSGVTDGDIQREFTNPSLAKLAEVDQIIGRLRATAELSGWERRAFDDIDNLWHEARMQLKSARENTGSGANFLMACARRVEVSPEQRFACTGRVSRAQKDGRDYWRICPTDQGENLLEAGRLLRARGSKVTANYRSGETGSHWQALPEARWRMAPVKGVMWLRFEGEGEYRFKCQGARPRSTTKVDEYADAPPAPGRKPESSAASASLTAALERLRDSGADLFDRAEAYRTNVPGVPSAESAVKTSGYYMAEEDFKNAIVEATRAIAIYTAHSARKSGTSAPAQNPTSPAARWRAFISAHHWPEPDPQADQGLREKHAQEQVQQALGRLSALQATARKWERLAELVPKLLGEPGGSAPRLVSYGEIAWTARPLQLEASQLFADWQGNGQAKLPLDAQYGASLKRRIEAEALGRWREHLLSRYRAKLSELEYKAAEAEEARGRASSRRGVRLEVVRKMAALIDNAKTENLKPVRDMLDGLEKDAEMGTWDLTKFRDIDANYSKAETRLDLALYNTDSGQNFVEDWATDVSVKRSEHRLLTGKVSKKNKDMRDYLRFRAQGPAESIRLRLVSVTDKSDKDEFRAWYLKEGSEWQPMPSGEDIDASGAVLVLIDGTGRYTFACLGADANWQTPPRHDDEATLSH